MQPSQYRCMQSQYRFAVISEAPSMIKEAWPLNGYPSNIISVHGPGMDL